MGCCLISQCFRVLARGATTHSLSWQIAYFYTSSVKVTGVKCVIFEMNGWATYAHNPKTENYFVVVLPRHATGDSDQYIWSVSHIKKRLFSQRTAPRTLLMPSLSGFSVYYILNIFFSRPTEWTLMLKNQPAPFKIKVIFSSHFEPHTWPKPTFGKMVEHDLAKK